MKNLTPIALLLLAMLLGAIIWWMIISLVVSKWTLLFAEFESGGQGGDLRGRKLAFHAELTRGSRYTSALIPFLCWRGQWRIRFSKNAYHREKGWPDGKFSIYRFGPFHG